MKKPIFTGTELNFSEFQKEKSREIVIPHFSTNEEALKDLRLQYGTGPVSCREIFKKPSVAYFGTKLLVVLIYGLILFLVGCQESKSGIDQSQASPNNPVNPPTVVPSTSNPVSVGEAVLLSNGKPGVVLYPTVETSGSIPWVWYAPAFLDSATQDLPIEIQWLATTLRAQGIAFVVANAGDVMGAPIGRDLFEEFYGHFTKLGLQTQGCMILQSRGGLMGYTWQLDHPGRVKCNLGFYPLLSLDDYVGLDRLADIWGVDRAWLRANQSQHDPLMRAGELTMPILHIHGDSDPAVHLDYNREFLSRYGGPRWGMQLLEVNDLGHTYTKEMFEHPYAVEFLIQNLL